jgi:hypothetical protein
MLICSLTVDFSATWLPEPGYMAASLPAGWLSLKHLGDGILKPELGQLRVYHLHLLPNQIGQVTNFCPPETDTLILEPTLTVRPATGFD